MPDTPASALSTPEMEALLDELLGKKSALRQCYERTLKGSITYKEKQKDRMLSAFTAVEAELFQFCFKHHKNDFVKPFLIPTLQAHAERDERCSAYLQLPDRFQNSLTLVVRMMAHIFSNQEIFDTFCRLVPEELVQALRFLSFETRRCSVKDVEQKLKVNVIVYTKENYHTYSVNYITTFAPFMFVSGQYDYSIGNYRQYITLPLKVYNVLRERFLHGLPPALQPIQHDPTTSDDTLLHYATEETLPFTADMLMSYIAAGKVELKGGETKKPTKSALRQMSTMCEVREFFFKEHTGYKELETLATEMLYFFLNPIANTKTYPLGIEVVQKWFERYSAGKYILLDGILSFLKWNLNYREVRTEKQVIDILHQLDAQSWYDVESLLEHARRHKDSFAVIDEDYFDGQFYITPTADFTKEYPYERNHYLRATDYFDAVIAPYLKGTMFLFAALGLVEIVYNVPVNPTLQNGAKPYLSPYDGLQAVRVTALGKFIIGETKSYIQSKPHDRKAEYSVFFDEKRLLVSLHADDKKRQMYMSDFAKTAAMTTTISAKQERTDGAEAKSAEQASEQSSPRTYYKMSYADFLADCRKRADVVKKIERFRTYIVGHTNPLPSVWENFFTELLAKIEPLRRRPTLVMFSVKPSPELMHLLTHDHQLREIVHKAEGFHIFVEESNVPALTKRLRECGYLMSP
jgi:hypothetical protein